VEKDGQTIEGVRILNPLTPPNAAQTEQALHQ
jgi:hypothetical protein